MSANPRNETLSPKDVAEETGFPLSTVYKLIDEGRLPAIKVGRAIRIRRITLERWIEEEEHAHGTATSTKQRRPVGRVLQGPGR